MPSAKLKNRIPAAFRSKAAQTCSESELIVLALALGRELKPGDRVLLEGPMGAGKTTFARGVLEGLKIPRESEGSPTFPIAHEYETPDGVRVLHADFYRLETESELEVTGLLEALWDPDLIVLSEWLERFEDVTEKLRESADLRTIHLIFEFDPEDQSRRRIRVREAS